MAISILLLLSTIAQNTVYFLKSKDEALEIFILYKTEVENQLNRKLIRSDRGGEYVTPVGDYYAQHGIRHEVTPPYSPE